MRRSYSIEEKVAEVVARLNAKLGVERAFLFGSTARGSRLGESDVDLILVSRKFEGVPIPERQGVVQKEWLHGEELQALTYTPAEFAQVSKRVTMQEILSHAVDVSPSGEGFSALSAGREGRFKPRLSRIGLANRIPIFTSLTIPGER